MISNEEELREWNHAFLVGLDINLRIAISNHGIDACHPSHVFRLQWESAQLAAWAVDNLRKGLVL